MDKMFIETFFVNVAPYSSPECLPLFLARAQESCEWLESRGLKVKGRIPYYRQVIKNYDAVRGTYGPKMFEFLHAVSEMHHVVKCSEQLKEQQASSQFKNTLTSAMYGINFSHENDTPSKDQDRNYMFELGIASSYAAQAHRIDVSKRTDIIVNDLALAIECKRIQSPELLVRRFKKAIEQLQKHEAGEAANGVVYIDVTEILDVKHTAYIHDQTRVPPYRKPPPDEDEVVKNLYARIEADIAETIEDKMNLLKPHLTDEVSCVVLNFNFCGFEINMIREFAIVGRCSFILDNDKVEPAAARSVRATLGRQFI